MSSSSDFLNYPHSQLPLPANAFIKKIWRKGKWTEEEEAYAEKIVLAFNAGILDVPPGITLRSALSELLNCDPMRITKKYAGSCIGKQPFQPIRPSDLNSPLVIELKKDLEKTKEEFHALIERNQELQNSNNLFTTHAPYSQFLQEYIPVAADSGDNYHAMLHQHAMASLHAPPTNPQYPNSEIQAISYHDNSGYFTDPDLSSTQKSSIPLHDPPSEWQSYSDYHEFLPSHQQPQSLPSDPLPTRQHLQSTHLPPHPATASPIDRDREWGIPSFYDPLASPRLPILYSSSIPSTPHTTNQPYIYLPPRLSTPPMLPRCSASLSSDDILKPPPHVVAAGNSLYGNPYIPIRPQQLYPASYSQLNSVPSLVPAQKSQNISRGPTGEDLQAAILRHHPQLQHPPPPIEPSCDSTRSSASLLLSHEKKRKK